MKGTAQVADPAATPSLVDGVAADAAAKSASRRPQSTDVVAARLEALTAMASGELRAEWRRLYRSAPPMRLSHDLLLLAVAWKLQVQANGGLGATTRRRLADLTDKSKGNAAPQTERSRLKPGARLIREWHGQTHVVEVQQDGFLWQGRSWRSLSVIARAITGARWSGPRFFGLPGTDGAFGSAVVAESSPAKRDDG